MDRKEDRVENKHRRTREKGNMDTGQRQERESRIAWGIQIQIQSFWNRQSRSQHSWRSDTEVERARAEQPQIWFYVWSFGPRERRTRWLAMLEFLYDGVSARERPERRSNTGFQRGGMAAEQWAKVSIISERGSTTDAITNGPRGFPSAFIYLRQPATTSTSSATYKCSVSEAPPPLVLSL